MANLLHRIGDVIDARQRFMPRQQLEGGPVYRGGAEIIPSPTAVGIDRNTNSPELNATIDRMWQKMNTPQAQYQITLQDQLIKRHMAKYGVDYDTAANALGY